MPAAARRYYAFPLAYLMQLRLLRVMEKTLLSIGHGYSAKALARRLLPNGWRIIGTTRSPEKAFALKETGIEAMVWPGGKLPLGEVSHVLTSVSPGSDGDPVLAAQGAEIAGASHLK